MKLIIDIPEEMYKSCKREYEESDDLIIDTFTFAIANGTQMPFMNKPCVAHQVCHEDKVKVLDKIRSDIEKAVWEDVVISLDGADEVRIPRLDPDDVFEIIDKYKSESEVTDADSD